MTQDRPSQQRAEYGPEKAEIQQILSFLGSDKCITSGKKAEEPTSHLLWILNYNGSKPKQAQAVRMTDIVFKKVRYPI